MGNTSCKMSFSTVEIGVFTKLKDDLLSTKEIRGVQLSVVDKVLYTVMLNRFKFFNSDLFDTQDFYAEKLAVSVGTIKNSLNKLKEAGLIEVKTEIKVASGARKKNYYKVLNYERK